MNKPHDTSSSFYSNIDKLFKLVDISLQKGQIKNAEKYINYFFEVMIRFYKKSTNTSKITSHNVFPINVTDNVEVKLIDNKAFESIFPDRTIDNVFGDFFTDKIMRLLSANIKTDGFEVFHFVLGRLKDSIRILIKEKSTYEKATVLLRQFKFIVDQIHSHQDKLSSYEKNWFLSESYNWFVELYAGNVKTVDDIGLFESEILQILKYFIDTKRVDLFERFLERLSSSIFSYSFDNERIINKYKPKDFNLSWEYEKTIRAYREIGNTLQNLYDFKETIKEIDEKINEDFKKFNLTSDEIKDFKIHFFELLIDEFKETYLKVILIKIITYSFFKKETSYFDRYLKYNQPDDSDAIWASKYYGIQSLTEIFSILPKAENLILRDALFHIGHHGFKIYVNTFLAYYLLNSPEKEVISRIQGIKDYTAIVIIEQELKSIQNANRISLLEGLLKNLTPDLIDERLNLFIEAAGEKKVQLDFNIITKSEVSPDIVNNFKNLFVEHFYKCCSMRLIFKQYGLLELTNENVDENGIGINELLHKKAFLKESDVLYFNMHDSLAGGLADSESLTILYELESASRKISLKQSEFETFLIDNKNTYDIILSKGRYLVKSDFENLNFTESWSMTSEFNKIPDYLGVLENHFNIFFLRIPSREGYLLLNSTKIGVLKQFFPPIFKGAEHIDIFNFSMIDFKNDPESLRLHANANMKEDELLKLIWVRIFEKFRLELNSNFDGVSVELTS